MPGASGTSMRVLLVLWLVAIPVVLAVSEADVTELGEADAAGRRGKASTVRRAGTTSTVGFFSASFGGFQGNFEENEESKLGEDNVDPGNDDDDGGVRNASANATLGALKKNASAAVWESQHHSYNDIQADSEPKNTAEGRVRFTNRRGFSNCTKALCACAKEPSPSGEWLKPFRPGTALTACKESDDSDRMCADLSMSGGSRFGGDKAMKEAQPQLSCTQCPENSAFVMTLGKNRTGVCHQYSKVPFVTCINIGLNEYDSTRKPSTGTLPRLCTKVVKHESHFRVQKHHHPEIQAKATGWNDFATLICNGRKEVVCEGAKCSVKKTIKCDKVCKTKELTETTVGPDPENCIKCPKPREGSESLDNLCFDTTMTM